MFSDRSDAFDFNVALSDHEKHLRRDKDVAAARSGGEAGPASASADAPSPEVAALYRRQDLSLREGETVKCGPRGPPLPDTQACDLSGLLSLHGAWPRAAAPPGVQLEAARLQCAGASGPERRQKHVKLRDVCNMRTTQLYNEHSPLYCKTLNT